MKGKSRAEKLWAWLSAGGEEGRVDRVKTVLLRSCISLLVSLAVLGWSGCSARSPQENSEATKAGQQSEPVAQPSSTPAAGPPSFETFSAFLDRA